MKKIIILFVFVLLCGQVLGQRKIGFSDLHAHSILKNISNQMQDLDNFFLRIKAGDTTLNAGKGKPFDKKNRNLFRKYPKVSTNSKFDSRQCDYSLLADNDYSIVSLSISPIEKYWVKRSKGLSELSPNVVFALSGAKRAKRKMIRDENNTPFEFYQAEIEYAKAQDQIFNNSRKPSERKIYLARDSEDLAHIVDDLKATAMVISIEGGHVTMGEACSGMQNKYTFNCIDEKFTQAEIDETYANLSKIINGEHRVFFVAPAHHWWNQIMGQAIIFDKDDYRFAAKLATSLDYIKNMFYYSFGEGMLDTVYFKGKNNDKIIEALPHDNGTHELDCDCNAGIRSLARFNTPFSYKCYDSYYLRFKNNEHRGRRFIDSLLSTHNKFGKPVYIDIKHMDVKARQQYYKILENKKKQGIHIPIICSHTGVSGESEKLAMLTSSKAFQESYLELKYQDKYYLDLINRHNMHGCKPWIDDLEAKRKSHGWFYSWGINVYDEEIKKIYDTDGMLGLILDERVLGSGMTNYSKIHKDTTGDALKCKYGFTKSRIIDYLECEPFIRNLDYVLNHSGKDKNDKSAWQHVCIGSDFDGVIDPLDVCRNAGEVADFEKMIIEFYPIFLTINGRGGEMSEGEILFGIPIAKGVEWVFRDNAYNFIRKYF